MKSKRTNLFATALIVIALAIITLPKLLATSEVAVPYWNPVDQAAVAAIGTRVTNLEANNTDYAWVVAAVEANDSAWDNTVIRLDSNQGNWNWAYDAVEANDESWDNAVVRLDANQTAWDNATARVDSNQEIWNNAATRLDSNQSTWNWSADATEANDSSWDNAVSRVDANQSLWDNAVSRLDANQAIWDNSASRLDANQGLWDNAVSRLDANDLLWDNAVSRLDSNQITWNWVASAVETNDAMWDNAASRLDSNQITWNNTTSRVDGNQAIWDNAASRLDANQENWNAKYDSSNFIAGTDYQAPLARSTLSADFDATTTTLADSDLSVTLDTAGTYHYRAVLFVDANDVGGHKYELSGTAPVSSILFHADSMDDDAGTYVIHQRRTSSAGAGWGSNAGETSIYTTIEGKVTTTDAGTFLIQFAQNAGPDGTSTIKAGSFLIVY